VTPPSSTAQAHIARVGTAVLLHGFSRGPRHLRVLSLALNRAGVATVRPALSAWDWSHGINSTRYLDVVAARIRQGLPEGPVAVVGHSAGAAAGAWIAGALLDSGTDVRRIVMVDGVESPAGLIRRAWPRLASVDIIDVCGEPSRCNRDGQLEHWLRASGRDVTITFIEGSGHGDIEVDRSPVYRWACGDESTDETRLLVLNSVVDSVVEGLTRAR
jgi:pimeloyl-ACP methyl ester carboxylesterase